MKKLLLCCKKHINSYVNAIAGIPYLIKELNFWAELIILLVVIVTAIILKLDIVIFIVWLALALLLISAEAFNTSIERLCNFINNNKYHKEIAIIKDLSALGVLIVALALFVSYLIGIYVSLF